MIQSQEQLDPKNGPLDLIKNDFKYPIPPRHLKNHLLGNCDILLPRLLLSHPGY